MTETRKTQKPVAEAQERGHEEIAPPGRKPCEGGGRRKIPAPCFRRRRGRNDGWNSDHDQSPVIRCADSRSGEHADMAARYVLRPIAFALAEVIDAGRLGRHRDVDEMPIAGEENDEPEAGREPDHGAALRCGPPSTHGSRDLKIDKVQGEDLALDRIEAVLPCRHVPLPAAPDGREDRLRVVAVDPISIGQIGRADIELAPCRPRRGRRRNWRQTTALPASRLCAAELLRRRGIGEV